MKLPSNPTLIGIMISLTSVCATSGDSSRRGRPIGMCSTKEGKALYNHCYKKQNKEQIRQYNSEYQAKMPTEKKEERKKLSREINANRYRSDREIVERTHGVPREELSEGVLAQLAVAQERIQKDKDTAVKKYQKTKEDPVKCSKNRLKSNVRKLAAKHRADPTNESDHTTKIAEYVRTEADRGFVSGEKLHSMAWDTWNSFEPKSRVMHRGSRLIASSSHS